MHFYLVGLRARRGPPQRALKRTSSIGTETLLSAFGSKAVLIPTSAWIATAGDQHCPMLGLLARIKVLRLKGAFPGGYTNIGAVQRQEGAGSTPTVSSLSVQ